MILAVMGADEDVIVSDYEQSDAHVDGIAFGTMERKELAGLDRALFSRAPAEAMRRTLSFCKDRYGSLSGYMTSCGFTPDKQDRLRAALTAPS